MQPYIFFQEIYFVRGTTNTSPKGKLYAKYYNSLRTLKKGGLLQTSKNNYKSKTLTNSELESNFGKIIYSLL